MAKITHDKPLVICCCYTEGTPYEEELQGLIESAGEHCPGTKVCAYGYPGLGSWIRNVNEKPRLVRRALDDHPENTILWVDVDARFERSPVGVLDTKGHFCFHRRKGIELLTGTLLIRPSTLAKTIAELWEIKCSEFQGSWDQRSLDRVVKDIKASPLLWFLEPALGELTAEYCWIAEEGDSEDYPAPVIVHTQASRKWRNHNKVTGYPVMGSCVFCGKQATSLWEGRNPQGEPVCDPCLKSL